MTLGERVLNRSGTRAQQVRNRRARVRRVVETPAKDRRYGNRNLKASRRKSPRRRYDISLPGEIGAEMQLPALPGIRLGLRVFSALLLVICLSLVRSLLAGPSFRVEAASVVGNELLQSAQIRSIASVAGESLFRVDPAAVAERLEGHPEIKQATVTISWPNQVEIQIVERFPLIEWQDAGRTWWLSASGIAFMQRGDRESMVRVVSESPVLNIREDPSLPVVESELVAALMELHQLFPEVKTLTFHPTHGLGIEDSRGWNAVFGRDGDMALKVRVYAALVERIMQLSGKAEFISVKDPAAPFYRMQR